MLLFKFFLNLKHNLSLNKMSVQRYDVQTSDYSVVYYGSSIVNRIKSIFTYTTGGTYEANEIVLNVFLGNIDSVYDPDALKKKNIKNIVSVINGFEPPYPSDFNYLVLDSLDTINTELQDKFELTYNFIEEALDRNEKVLIHCMYGRSRSATIMIAYLVRKFGYNVQDSLNYVKMCREDIEPNEYFVKQLENYYNKLYKHYLIN